METKIDVRKKFVGEELSPDQSSISDIPSLLYKYFSSKKISASKRTIAGEEIKYWCELPVSQLEKGRAIAIYTERKDGDAVETKFALGSWPPRDEEYREFYDFEIAVVLSGEGWSHNDGNKFKETLIYRTNKNSLGCPLPIDHSITVYVAEALAQAILFIQDSKFVQRQFVDNNPNSPR